MNKSTALTLSYIVLLALLAVFFPWHARSATDFRGPALLAIGIALAGHFLARFGLLRFVARQIESREELGIPTGGIWARWPVGFVKSVKLCCIISLLVGLAGIALGSARLLSPAEAFFFAVIGQQLIFICFELAVVARRSPDSGFWSRAANVVALMALATFFSWASNITFLAQRPPVPPIFSDATNLLFAVPAMTVGIAGLLIWSNLPKRP
jgi:hypothetical protein